MKIAKILVVGVSTIALACGIGAGIAYADPAQPDADGDAGTKRLRQPDTDRQATGPRRSSAECTGSRRC